MNKIIPFTLSAGLLTLIAVGGLKQGLPGFKNVELKKETSGAEQHIRGAIESVYSLRLNEKTGDLDPQWMANAVQQADNLKSIAKRLNKKIEWTNMGPDNVGGRIRAFLISKNDSKIWFAGGVSGGLFRSSTSGQSWVPINDLQENLNVTCIAQTPDGKIYYGTGEGGFTNLSGTRNGSPAFYGNGVYASSDDKGTAFSLMNEAKDNRFFECNGMAADPKENKFYVATESGLYEFDMTSTAKVTRLSSGSIKEVKVDSEGVVWASTSNGSVYKKEIGQAIKIVNQGYSSGGRTSIAISPDDNNYVYTMGAGGSGANYGKLVGVYRTTDGGTTWEQIITGNSNNNIFSSNNQGWYDNVIGVVPGKKDEIILGGVTLARWDKTNGYREFASTFGAPWNSEYVHADKHLITWNMNTNPATCIVGCDGGLYASQDYQIWTPLNRGFTTLQLYNVAANTLGHIVGGAQDNGTQLINFSGNSFNGIPSKTAISIYGGDGFDVEFSKFDPRVVFVSIYYGTVARSNNSGQSSSTFWDDRQAGTVQTDFNTTYNLWEKNEKESRLYLAKNNQVWMALNPTDFANPVNWFLVADGLGNSRIIEMDYTADGDHLFIAKQGALFRLDGLNSAEFTLDANPVATKVPTGIDLKQLSLGGAAGRTVTSVNVNPENSNHVVITLGGYGNSTYVYETENALDDVPTWKNITGNLPSMPVYDAVIDVDDPERIILGTDLGVWVTENGGTKWEEANDGMARVPVFEIRGYEWKPWEGMSLYIGTHGRGYYKSTNLLTNTKKVSKNNLEFNISPNPASDFALVKFNGVAGKATLRMIGLDGKIVQSLNVNTVMGENQTRVDLSNVKSGYYFVQVTLANGASETQKILVK
jgi:hypothetical protein